MTSSTRLRVGISSCPNDTFAFHGLLTGRSDPCGLDLQLDVREIQELNEGLARGDFDVAKASFHAALALAPTFGVLPAGAALGFGVGPLLLAAAQRPPPDAGSRVLCPGAGTTAFLLLRLLFPEIRQVEQVHFAEVMPRLARGEADFGVVIHEGRFTYARHGLWCMADLGARWEERSGGPLPLGGLLARDALGADVHRRMTAAVRQSIALARREPEAARATMRRHARELDDAAIWKHVELYVNDFTVDLGATGRAALAAFDAAARAAGFITVGTPPLRVLDA